ncbi:MAG TPA: hypothetical protein DEA08_22010, partial [Planctomycetes bacterium]|nr:hypothetical protein [Planctomycetota bacterium]
VLVVVLFEGEVQRPAVVEHLVLGRLDLAVDPLLDGEREDAPGDPIEVDLDRLGRVVLLL